jgi:uncharacterized protein (TIGR03492 family)
VFKGRQVQFCLAVTPNLLAPDDSGEIPIDRAARSHGWIYRQQGQILAQTDGIEILCRSDAFAEIMTASDIVVGMAGTAIEQAVGLGKPVIQIPGKGPQFTYRFAEAQMRLLGPSVQTIGTTAATPETIARSATAIDRTLNDRTYLDACLVAGLDRVGTVGGSAAMAAEFWNRVSG